MSAPVPRTGAGTIQGRQLFAAFADLTGQGRSTTNSWNQDCDPTLSISFENYDIYHPGVDQPWGELPRKEAKAAYDRLMAAKPERLAQLVAIVGQSGLTVPPPEEAADSDLDALEDWFRAGIAATDGEKVPQKWYSVISDLGLYLGEAMIHRTKSLMWIFFTAKKKDMSYQESVISGFTKIPNPHYHVNPGFLVATLALNLKEGKWVAERNFTPWVSSVSGETD